MEWPSRLRFPAGLSFHDLRCQVEDVRAEISEHGRVQARSPTRSKHNETVFLVEEKVRSLERRLDACNPDAHAATPLPPPSALLQMHTSAISMSWKWIVALVHGQNQQQATNLRWQQQFSDLCSTRNTTNSPPPTQDYTDSTVVDRHATLEPTPIGVPPGLVPTDVHSTHLTAGTRVLNLAEAINAHADADASAHVSDTYIGRRDSEDAPPLNTSVPAQDITPGQFAPEQVVELDSEDSE
eukprot:4464735-Amphidinium_carterae.2